MSWFNVYGFLFMMVILVLNNTTRYMSELKTGEEILCVSTKGDARLVVDRNEIEKRPLLMINAVVGEIKNNTSVSENHNQRRYFGFITLLCFP